MTPDQLRWRCLALPGAGEDFPWGDETSVFKVAGKVFAITALGADPLEVSVKCDPALAESLRAAHTAVRPGYHLNKRHWNTVTVDGSLADDELAAMVEDSYDLVVATLTRAQREGIAGTDSEA
ncbi:MAG: MmcQ/YjbR family DNA-binding protein [Acidimicrobiales bacterium]